MHAIYIIQNKYVCIYDNIGRRQLLTLQLYVTIAMPLLLHAKYIVLHMVFVYQIQQLGLQRIQERVR